MQDRLKQLNGLLVLKSPDGELLGFAKNLVLKQGYDMILSSFAGLNPTVLPTQPKALPFIDKVKCGNGTAAVGFEDVSLSGSIQITQNIDNVLFSTLDGHPIVEAQFVIYPGSNLVGSNLSEVGFYASMGGVEGGIVSGMLFSRLLLETPISMQPYTMVNGYYYLSTSEIDVSRIFDDTFDESFE